MRKCSLSQSLLKAQNAPAYEPKCIIFIQKIDVKRNLPQTDCKVGTGKFNTDDAEISMVLVPLIKHECDLMCLRQF